MRQKSRLVCAIAGILGLVATNAYAQDVRPVQVSFGAGVTWPNSEVRDHLGNGYNINFGLQFNVTKNIGIEGLYSFNGLGDKTIVINTVDNPINPGTGVPTDFSADMNMQYGTGAVVFQGGSGKARGYGLVGMGVYYRPIKVTTPGVGYVPGYCDPWWYYCVPGGFVPVENIIGERSSTDFGMVFGGGVNVSSFYTELRYHYIWGPTVEQQTIGGGTVLPTPITINETKANGQFLQLTFGVRF